MNTWQSTGHSILFCFVLFFNENRPVHFVSELFIFLSVKTKEPSNDSTFCLSGYPISIHQGASGGVLVYSLGRRRVQTRCSSPKETGKGVTSFKDLITFQSQSFPVNNLSLVREGVKTLALAMHVSVSA